MFEFEPTARAVDFQYGCQQYSMTEVEIEAAYRFQESRYRRDDALNQLNTFVFGDEDTDPESTDGLVAQAEFEDEYGVTYETAKELLDEFVERFIDERDCDIAENDTWRQVIEDVILENS